MKKEKARRNSRRMEVHAGRWKAVAEIPVRRTASIGSADWDRRRTRPDSVTVQISRGNTCTGDVTI